MNDRWARACGARHTAPRCGRFACLPFESPAERRLGIVTHSSGDRGDTIVGVAKELRRELKAPSDEIVHWRLTEEMPKALRQDRAGQPNPSAKLGDLPGMGRIRVDELESFTHQRVSQSREPADLVVTQVFHRAAKNFHEQQLDQAREQGSASRPLGPRVLGAGNGHLSEATSLTARLWRGPKERAAAS